jgi:tagatose 6-phosphate kinase
VTATGPVTATSNVRVLCAALNPALDITYASGRFVTGEANRVCQVHAQAGGKAVNVARLLSQTGHDVLLTGFAGGLVGKEIQAQLDDWRLEHRFVQCATGSRRTVSAFSTDDGTTTGYNEGGPRIALAEWEQFADGFRVLASAASAVVLSGSLPAGLPVETYRTLAEVAQSAGARAFVDAHSGSLLAALAARPALVKPNEHELAEAVGLAVPVCVPDAVAAARKLLSLGARGVVVSLGPRGVLGVLPDSALLATPRTERGNPVGAGDAAMAALVAGDLAGQPWPDRLRRAAAMSAAAVRQPVAGQVSADDVAELEALVEVREL